MIKILVVSSLLISIVLAHTSDVKPVDVHCKYYVDDERGYVAKCEDVKLADQSQHVRFTGVQVEKKTNEDVKFLDIVPPSDIKFFPSKDIFTYYVGLQNVEACNVNIEKLDYIYNCFELVNITLSNNQISEIEFDTFFLCRDLLFLDLSYNQIKDIPENTFSQPSNIIELNLSINRIEKLTRKHFKPMKKLRKVNLHANNIQKLSHDIFNDLFDLNTLDLSHNPIISLDSRFFDFVMFLENLNLAGTNLRKFLPGTFKSLKRLKTLDISANFFQSLDGEMLAKNGELHTLKISQCSINEIGEHFFDKLPKLSLVESRGNRCFDGLAFSNNDEIKQKFATCIENDERKRRAVRGEEL